jgi:hypothetical protein
MIPEFRKRENEQPLSGFALYCLIGETNIGKHIAAAFFEGRAPGFSVAIAKFESVLKFAPHFKEISR